MNYSSKNFTEPNRFIPERWLAQDKYQGQLFDKRRHNALQSFSVGPRNCIGKKFVTPFPIGGWICGSRKIAWHTLRCG